METETRTNTKETPKPILQTLGEGMLKAQQEIDELVLQLSSGKANAKEKFEEVKNEFIDRLNLLKKFLKSMFDKINPRCLEVTARRIRISFKNRQSRNQRIL